jgi:hypothetical protein
LTRNTLVVGFQHFFYGETTFIFSSNKKYYGEIRFDWGIAKKIRINFCCDDEFLFAVHDLQVKFRMQRFFLRSGIRSALQAFALS